MSDDYQFYIRRRDSKWIFFICIQIDKNQPNNFYTFAILIFFFLFTFSSSDFMHYLLLDPFACNIYGQRAFFSLNQQSWWWWLYNCCRLSHESTAMIYGQCVKRHEMWSNKNWNFMSSEHDRCKSKSHKLKYIKIIFSNLK